MSAAYASWTTDAKSYRLDDQPVVIGEWTVDGSSRSLLVPPDPEALVESLQGVQQFGVLVDWRIPLIFIFDVSALLKTPAQPNIDTCGEY